MVLYWLKHACSIKTLAFIFGLNQPYETLHHTVLAMLTVLVALELRWPSPEQQKYLASLRLFRPYSKAIGATDGTYTECTRCDSSLSGHRSCFCRTAQCFIDSTGFFILVLAGLAGARHDAAGYKLTALGKGEVKLEKDIFLISDSAYSSFDELNCPVDNGIRESDPGVKQTFTNCRTKIEHSFARLKAHFQICDRKWKGPAGFRLQAESFMLACALYNRKLRLGMFKAY